MWITLLKTNATEYDFPWNDKQTSKHKNAHGHIVHERYDENHMKSCQKVGTNHACVW